MAENCNESEEERAGRLVRNRKQRQQAKMQLLPCEVHGKISEYKREEQRVAKRRKRVAVFEA